MHSRNFIDRFRNQRIVLFALCAIAGIVSPAKLEGQQVKVQALRIGTSSHLTAEVDSDTEKSAMNALTGLIKEETGFDNEIVHQNGWRELVDRMATGQLEVGIFQGYEFAWATESNRHLKSLVLANNGARYPVVSVVARHDNPAKDFAGLQGQSIALPATPHWESRLFVDRNCRANGKSPEVFFSKIASQYNVQDALDDVVDGLVQAAVVDQVVLEAFKHRKPGRFERLREVARSQPFPPTVIAYDDRILDEASRRQFQNTLLGAAAKEKHTIILSLFQWTGFEMAPDDFEHVLAETRKTYPAPRTSSLR